jgi:glutamine amidotransferase
MHNGQIGEFSNIKRELTLAVDPELFASIEGSTDSELMFYLALSLGLADDPIAAVERMAGLVEKIAERHGIENSLQMSLATTNGEQLWVFRYSTEQRTSSLFYSTHVRALRDIYPGNPRLEGVSEEARLIVSEPLSNLSGVWNEVPEGSCGVLQAGEYQMRPFRPRR